MTPSPQDTAPGRAHSSVDWFHWAIVTVVFSITGVLSLLFSRFLLSGILHLEGGIWSGPWSFRIAYLLVIPPFYSVALVVVGTFFGKHTYFRQRVVRTWGRLLPRSTHSRSILGRRE